MAAKTMLEVRNSYCRLPFEADADLIRDIDAATSYLVQGHEHAHAFRKKWWDGREHLLKFSQKQNVYMFPTGVLPELLKLPLAAQLEVVDHRRPTAEPREIAWTSDKELRDYQLKSVEQALAERGVVTGRGLLNLPIRSGKTLTAARIIQQLGLPALFVVPSEMLLEQTISSFTDNLGDVRIGKCGGGEWQPEYVTVCTFQGLIAKPARAAKLLANRDVLIVDEAHHLEAPAWRAPLLSFDGRYKIGLSATLFVNKDIPAERSSIWLRAVTGPILHRVSMKTLFDRGHLVPPRIYIYPVDKPHGMADGHSYKSVYEKLIADSHYRNAAIVDLAQQGTERGLRVLIDTGRISQMKALVKMLQARDIEAREIHGKTPSEKRQTLLRQFQAGEIACLVGTVLGEGIDIPELEMVINAEGGAGKKAVVQRMRNLTPSEGKDSAVFVDFADLTNKYLREHSLSRIAMYKGIRGFKVLVGKVDNDKFVLPETL